MGGIYDEKDGIEGECSGRVSHGIARVVDDAIGEVDVDKGTIFKFGIVGFQEENRILISCLNFVLQGRVEGKI